MVFSKEDACLNFTGNERMRGNNAVVFGKKKNNTVLKLFGGQNNVVAYCFQL
jgi:hypothetical protein